jgi:hypothetical protein
MAEQKTNELFNQYLKTLCHDPDTLWQPRFPGVFSLITQVGDQHCNFLAAHQVNLGMAETSSQ